MKHILLTSIIFLLLTLSGFCQDKIVISGQVYDEKTKEPIAFVNIGIEGTLIGTASDVDGNYSLTIPLEYQDKNLYFSAIGYENLIINQSSIETKNIILLKSLSYGIGDVEITTRSKVLYRIINETSKAVDDNFITHPCNYNLLYHDESYIENILSKKRDATVLLYDASGYKNRENSFTDRAYKFLNAQRNFDVKTLADGTTLMDDLLSFDFARTNNNILDIKNLNEFDLDLVEEIAYNNDSVWVIAFKLSNSDFSKTGTFKPSLYEGKIYVSKTNNVPYKIETHIKSDKQSSLGRNAISNADNSYYNVDYYITTIYKENNSKYILDNISMKGSYSTYNKQLIKRNATLTVTKFNANTPRIVKKRAYFEGLTSDPNFWIELN